MQFLIAGLLVLLLLAFLGSRKRPALKALVVALALLSIGASLYGILRPPRRVVEAQTQRWQEVFGYELGRMIAEDHPQGASVLVLDIPADADGAFVKAKLKGLRAAVEPKPITFTLADRDVVLRALGSPSNEDFTPWDMVTAQAAAQIVSEHPGTTCLASFLGPIAAGKDSPPLPPVYAILPSPGPEQALPYAPHPSTQALAALRDWTALQDANPHAHKALDAWADRLFTVLRPPFTPPLQEP